MTTTLADTPFYCLVHSGSVGSGLNIPLWLRESRLDDERWLASCQLPSSKDQEWKYSSLASLWQQSFQRVERCGGDDIQHKIKSFYVQGANNILIVDGSIVSAPANLLSGVRGDVSVALGEAAFRLLNENRRCLDAVTRNDSRLFLQLNRLLFGSPLAVTLRNQEQTQDLINIINVITQPGAAVFPRLFIDVEGGASLNLVQTFVSTEHHEHLCVPVTDIILQDGACLEYAERHCHGRSSFYIGAVRAWLNKKTSLKMMTSTTGARIFRSNISVMINGEGASAEVNGLHDLLTDAHADSHTLLEHLAPNTVSNQLYKCVLRDAAHSVFNGMIDVHREAQQTSSYQLNRNLLLSRESRVDTKPQLEIRADDVKCTHGATISRLDEGQLFYLRTRAIDPKDAVSMVVNGFKNDVINRVRHPQIREAMLLAASTEKGCQYASGY